MFSNNNGGMRNRFTSEEKQDLKDVMPPPYVALLTPKGGAEAVIASGVARHNQRLDMLFLKAVWGGIFLSYGGLFEAVVGGSTWEMQNNAGILRLIEGLVFPVGLTMIVLSGTELLTSDMMFLAVAALKGRIPLWGVLVNYFVVFFGNLAGSLFFGMVLVHYAGLVDSQPIANFITSTAESRSLAPWYQVFLRGIGCNIMVCMSVYLAGQANDLVGKVFGVWIPLCTFVVCHYEHVVADMFTIPLGIKIGANVSVARYIGTPLTAALVGNIVGAWLLGGTFYWLYLRDVPNPKHASDRHPDPENGSDHTQV